MDKGHLDREDDTLRISVLRKSCLLYRERCPEHPNSCQDDPMSSKTPIQDFVDGGHLDKENDSFESLGLRKSGSFYRDRCLKHPNSCQDDSLFSKTPIQDFVDWGNLDREDDSSERCHPQSPVLQYRESS